MDAFDPDAYLADVSAEQSAATAFDPDEYLNDSGEGASPAMDPRVVDAIANAASASNSLVPQWMSKALLTRGGKVGDIAAEVVPAVGGTILGSAGGPGGMAAGGAAGAAVGNSFKQIRQMVRGERTAIQPGELGVATATGALPLGKLKAGADVVKVLGTRAMQGGVIAAVGDATQQAIDDGEIDWGRVALSGAIGTSLGMVLGAPEAIALRKAFGGSVPLEGKTLADAIDTVAKETGTGPSEIQRRINQMVGIEKPAASAEIKTPLQQQIETKVGIPASAPATPPAAADTLFAQRLKAQTGANDLGATTAELGLQRAEGLPIAAKQQASEMSRAMKRTQVSDQPYIAPVDNAETRLQLLDQRFGAGQGAQRERQSLSAALKPRVVEPPADALPGMSAQAQRMYDQYGRINPAALFPVARAAVGGALGYATGDTPEERVTNALLGMGLGAGASPDLVRKLVTMVRNAPVTAEVAAAAGQVINKLRLAIAPQSLLPKAIQEAVRWGDQAVGAIKAEGVSLTKDLERAIGSTGNAAMQGKTAAAVLDYLTGALPLSALPTPVRTQAAKVRNYVDTLTDRAVAEGVVEGAMKQTFLDNRGSYLRRSYEIFLDPAYKPAPSVVQAAIKAVGTANNIGAVEAEGIVAGILDRNGRAALGDFLVGQGRIAGKDVSSLIRRKDLLPEVRALLGEVKDPLLAANQTISRMARLVEHTATQRRVRELGTQIGLFSNTQSLARPTPLVAEGSATHDVLAGLYAAPEIADAMRRSASSGRGALIPELLWKGLTTGSSVAKAAKTVFNPESYAPNFLGGLVMMAGNGNFRIQAAGRGLALGAEEMGALRAAMPNRPTRDALRTELTELRRMGVLGESVNGQDLLRTIDQSFWSRISDSATTVLRIPSKAYGAIDDFTRYLAYQSERARYAKALPGSTEEDIRRHAADVVRATMPTYSEIPRVVKQLSQAGISPPFVNFTWEVFRNTANTVKIGLRDLAEGQRTGNAALRNEGAKRLATLAAVLGASSGYGIAKMSRDENGVTDARDEAVRYFSPPWNRNASLQYHTPVGAGEPIAYSNLSYLLPHAVVFEAIEAGKRGASDGEAIPEFLKALGTQFGANPATDSVIARPAIGALTGRDAMSGREIPKTEIEPTVGDRAKYFADEAFRPLALDWIEKFRKAKSGEAGDYGRVYSVPEQLRRLVGIRQQTLDPKQAVPWKARDLAKQLNGAADIYRLRRNLAMPPERLEQFYERANDQRKQVFGEMRAMLGHAQQLGVGEEEVIAAMRSAKIAPNVILGVLDDHYVPLDRERRKTAGEIFAEIQDMPATDRRRQLAQIYAEDPAIVRAVLERAKQGAKDQALGITERDRLVQSLGVSDGERATYIARRLEEQPTSEARRAYLKGLASKGLLTEKVLAQMVKQQRP